MPEQDDELSRELDAEGIPPVQDTVTSDQSEGVMAPRDRPVGAEEHGTTQAEAQVGESVAQRAAREEPDVGAEAALEAEPEAGRLTPVEAEGMVDAEPEAVAERTGDPGALSAEEEAVHVLENREGDRP